MLPIVQGLTEAIVPSNNVYNDLKFLLMDERDLNATSPPELVIAGNQCNAAYCSRVNRSYGSKQ